MSNFLTSTCIVSDDRGVSSTPDIAVFSPASFESSLKGLKAEELDEIVEKWKKVRKGGGGLRGVVDDATGEGCGCNAAGPNIHDNTNRRRLQVRGVQRCWL